MSKFAAVISLVLLSAPLFGAETLDYSKVCGVAAGVLQWKDAAAFHSFDADNRLDRVLYDTFVRLGASPSRFVLLLDKQATLSAILSQIASAAATGSADSIFVFYYAGHGMKNAGQVYFANYDIDSRSPASTGLTPAAIAKAVYDNFRGKRVILLADCCYSGALNETAGILAAKGYRVAVAASAERSNESTGSWAFTWSVIGSLSGNPFADRNSDGGITLNELRDETAECMRDVEGQRSDFELDGMDGNIVFAASASNVVRTESGGFGTGEYVTFFAGGGDVTGRITGFSGGKARIEYLDYSRTVFTWQPLSKLTKIEFREYPQSLPVYVLWGGKYYLAKILKIDNGFYYVTYPGWDSSWDEWVDPGRIAEKDEAVYVEWNGAWYPARILKREGEQALISYLGYGSEWDEWVGPVRMRRP